MPTHAFILIHNASNSSQLTNDLVKGNFPDFADLKEKKTELFSSRVIAHFIEEEERHDLKIVTQGTQQSLRSMSSGERKKALLHYLLKSRPEVIILINPLDNLDPQSQQELKNTVHRLSQTVRCIQIGSRGADAFTFISEYYRLTEGALEQYANREALFSSKSLAKLLEINSIPPPIQPYLAEGKTLVQMDGISVSFDNKPVIKDVHWRVLQGEFWQLKGPNGSGKSTLLNMITGDSHKGYGQNLTIFGRKKGSGESIWELKEAIGYFSPVMIDRFKGYHTLKNMVISGLYDSVGLYHMPSDVEKTLAEKWLRILQLEGKGNAYFNTLSEGEKRLIMIARAMIKHPPLLILDEPTVGLDDNSAAFFVALINAFASQSTSAVVFVSHREEPGLQPDFVYELVATHQGAEGKVCAT